MKEHSKDIVLSSIQRITGKNYEANLNEIIFEKNILNAVDLIYLLVDLYTNGYLNRFAINKIAHNQDLTLSYIIDYIIDK